MSLRFRLNLLITMVFLAILFIGAVLVIHNARKALAEETESTARLTLQLLELAFLQSPADMSPIRQSALMQEVREFGKARHLHIDMVHGGNLEPVPDRTLGANQPDAPAWFVKMVEPTSMVLRRSVLIPGMPSSELIIRPDPADEITEAWEEALSLLTLLGVFFVIANVLLFVIIGQFLKPINGILKGLDDIEQGDYQSRLANMNLPELNKIAQKFNHMAGVLESSRQQNRYLTQKNQAIQEEERRYLARELHDEMGQSISAIKALAVSISQRDLDEKTRNNASTIADISSRIYSVVRGMMRRLHPVVLEELGLLPALNDVIDDWNTHHENTFCHFDASDEFQNLPHDVAISIYRLVQECLTNVAKHAEAGDVYITLKRHGNAIALKIEDNGRGFDQSEKTLGLGLPGMRERVEALNGAFDLTSSVGKGTTIQVKLPAT